MSFRFRLLITISLGLLGACNGGTGSGDDEADVPQGPHALGSITITEAHASSGGQSTSSVAVGFMPDAATAPARCTREVAGCQLALVPDCNDTCGDEEYCTFSSSCTAMCKRACDADCGTGEECYFPTPNQPACRRTLSFDAGSIQISGTTAPITLFPPYSFNAIDTGSLFVDGAMLSVTATGATVAGYSAFSESFAATSLLRSSPRLDQLGIPTVFGTGSVPIRWVPGDDKVVVTATVIGTDHKVGTLTCKADDSAGSFDLPREAITAALDGDTLRSMSLAVTRTAKRTIYDVATMGSIAGVEIQPVGWVEMSTTSTESATLEGCSGDEQVCGNTCVDVTDSEQNCGSCGNACTGQDVCEQGTCSGQNACGTCMSSSSGSGGTCGACSANAPCSALRTCLQGCTTTTCQNQCSQTHGAAAVTLYNQWADCICNTACDLECENACGG